MKMTDRDVRAFASGCSIEISGNNGETQTYRLRPVVTQHLADLERDALSYYRNQYLDSMKQIVDVIGQDALIEEARKAGKWTVDDLPQKLVYDPADLVITEEAKAWCHKHAAVPDDEKDDQAYFDGIISLVYTSGRDEDPELSRVDVASWPIAKLMEAARAVEDVTAPSMGNT